MPLFAAATVLPLSTRLFMYLGLVPASQAPMPVWEAGLLATLLALVLHLLVLAPVFLASWRPGRDLVHRVAALGVLVAGYLALTALARLPWPHDRTLTATLQLALTLPYLLGVLGFVEARREGISLLAAWREWGLRAYSGPALWLGLAVAAIAVGPWVLVGSLGTAGTTAANVLHALPNALGEEILFRGLALAWLWRAMAGERPTPLRSGPEYAAEGSAYASRKSAHAPAVSLLLFVAAQGGTALPAGDSGVFPRFLTALALGLLFTELTMRAGGSIWPALIAHFLYDWFRRAFVDPRSEAEILHGVALTWAVIALGACGLLLWLGRVARERLQPGVGTAAEGTAGRSGRWATASLAAIAWAVVLLVYLGAGAPGFHPDGFLVYLEEQADLSQAATIADPVERRAWVVRTLADTAERTQAPLRAELERRGVRFRPHYLVNAIEVLDAEATPALRRVLARQPGVASVLFMPGMRPYPHTVAIPGADTAGGAGVEWNVRQVGADRVWAEGFTGQGIVVGSADTGVAWDHPALEAAYLGWSGTGPADHAYHWYDPWDEKPEPFDDSGHGTHTTGTMVGQDGGPCPEGQCPGGNQVGVAPGARWIACRNMRHGIGNAGAYISCMEFLLAPFPRGGDPFHDGDPARGAHVVNNSWGCPKMEGCLPDTLLIAVDHLRSAGQMMVVSAGNDGPVCSTVHDPPAIYDSVLSVGAVTSQGWPASFSSRGPVEADGSGRAKPDMVAPGVDIRSALPGGYGLSSGTSMAGPHVAGVVALLWSAQPGLIGDLARTEEILTRTAEPLTVDEAACVVTLASGQSRGAGQAAASGACPCGGDQSGTVPNNVFGWGQVNAWAAVQAATVPGAVLCR